MKRSERRRRAATRLQARVEAARAARRLPRGRPDAPRVRAAHAPAQADRDLAAAVARTVGTLDRGRRPARPAGASHIRRRRRRDALGRLRDQRLRRSQLRPAGRAHARPPARRRRVAPAEALFLFVALGLVAVWLALQLDPLCAALRRRGRPARRDLSLAQALRARAAVLSRRRFRLVDPDGIRRADRRSAEDRLAAAHSPSCSGPRSTTRCTRWWIARTTSASA